MEKRNRIIRKASLPEDAEGIMAVFSAAKAIMRSSGNVNQWKSGYPSLEAVQADIDRQGSYVIEENRMIVSYFAFLNSPEPTYARIYDGEWLDDSLPYHVIHRIASYPDVHGIFASIIEFCAAIEPNLRIDTHRDNHITQHIILKHGFTCCGIIHLASGDERLAYQRIKLVTNRDRFH
ncbi:MAG: N-acetyltransferase [Bacteroidaceae bacterium]|nr:N-acetyltransferase [Bacteroidaceae bacterium]